MSLETQMIPTTCPETEHAEHSVDDAASLTLRMSPAVPMSNDQFFDFCRQNQQLRLERTAKGEVRIMPPAGTESTFQNSEIVGQLYVWNAKDRLGRLLESSGGIQLPNGATRSPDAAWISNKLLATVPKESLSKFLLVCPEFVIELLSRTDSLRQTQRKLREFIENGAQLGWLIDPIRKRVHVYRPSRPAEILDQPRTVSADPELPGFVLDLDPIWKA